MSESQLIYVAAVTDAGCGRMKGSMKLVAGS